MQRLIRDRYFAYDEIRGCDLVTGVDVRLDELPDETSGAPRGSTGDWVGLAPLVEVLHHATDGEPRWIVADARNGMQATAMSVRAAADARRLGFVPVLVPLYLRWREALAADIQERTLLLIGSFSRGLASARAALVHAASRSPRPHVLLTFRMPHFRHTSVVREARAAYDGVPANGRPRLVTYPRDVLQLIERAGHASAFQRSGRHAAAERLLRDVAGSLARRRTFVPAATALVTLGRMLIERGRAASAESVFEEAAKLAESADHEAATLDARIWQAAARTDLAQLSEAEAMCRAVLLTRRLSPGRQAWATAVLARVLLWQGRCEEAGACLPTLPADADDIDVTTTAVVESTAVRVLLVTGHCFQAGQRARALMTRTDGGGESVARLVALTAHLRVLAATGDLDLTHRTLDAIVALAREARTPFRAIRARLVWHDALRRAGRDGDARQERERLVRLRRAAPPLLRRGIDQRIAAADRHEMAPAPAASMSLRIASSATVLLQLVHDEEDDRRALERVVARLARDLRVSRADLVTNDAGPLSTVVTHGAGLPTTLGGRTLEAGFTIADEVASGGREIGLPVRVGARLVAALVCRWPLDRQPPADANELLELAAAIAAPRVDTLLTSQREASRASTSVPELIGDSGSMQDVRRAIERAAKAPFAVLIEGESGVGKELVARAVHQLSARRERRFCDVNCAALPDDLLESELFGHVRGAFTGAIADKSGLFEEADGGTLFLDEIPDLSARGQAKLLRVLQQQEVRRIGETFSRKIDVRLVAAANRDMRHEAAQQRFRADLLYRLDVIRIRIPSLRERPEDIALLARHFWKVAAPRVESTATLTHTLLSELARYHWPGNVRELQNVIAALAVAAPARGRVPPSLLPAAITGCAHVTACRLSDARTQFERRCVEVALARAAGNRTRAAAELGLTRQGLLKTMHRLRIG